MRMILMGIMISLVLSPTNHNFIGTGVNVVAYVENAKAEVTNNIDQTNDNDNDPVKNDEKSEDVDKDIAENNVITSIASIIIPVNDQVGKTNDSVIDDSVADNLVEEEVLINESPTTDPSQESLSNDNDTIIEDQFAYPASSQNNHVKTPDINNLIEDEYQNNLWFWILLLLIISTMLLFIWCLLKEKEEKENNETD